MLTTKEAAERLNVTPGAVNKRVKKLGISKKKNGKFSFITEEDFERIANIESSVEFYRTTTIPTQHRPDTNLAPTQHQYNNESESTQIPDVTELNFMREQFNALEKNHIDQMKLLQKQMERERSVANEKDKQIAELQKSLDQEQRLHAGTMKQLNDTREQMKLIEHQPNEELNNMIEMLEKIKESFLQNMELLGRDSMPLTVHEGGKLA